MISPASEIAISSLTLTGNSENATAARPLPTACSSAPVPRPPPTKSMRLSVRSSPIPSERCEHLRVQLRHVERVARRLRLLRLLQRDGVPVAREEHRHVALACRNGRARLHAMRLRQRLEQLTRTFAGEVLHEPVVGQDLHLRVGKRHREEAVRLVRTAAAVGQRRARSGGRRGTMMAVRDVETRQPPERVDDCRRIGGRHPPQGVLDLVGRGEVVQRRRRGDASRDPVDLGRRLIRQEHGPRLRAQLHDVPRPVVFLVLPRLLVLQDDVAIVVVDGKRAREARLHVGAHAQAVEVEARLILDDERSGGSEVLIVASCRFVDDVRVRIGVGRQAELRARHVQEAQRMTFGELARFLGVDDVVWAPRRLQRRTAERDGEL